MNARMIFVVVLGFLAINGATLAEWTEPVPIAEINTEYIDKSPFLSFDGLTLYFCRMDTNTFYFARIYQATRPEPYGPFTSVEEISTLNYSGGHVDYPWVSPDDLRMYYCRTEPGSRWRLKVTERASIYDPWQHGTNISELNALGNIANESLTANELTIVFTGDNLPGGQGGLDLWMATRPDRNSPFRNVTNLTAINSSAQDLQTAISSDGLVLYFSSNRNGIGQLFKATRESLDAPFGNLEQLYLFDSLAIGGGPCLSGDGMAFYFVKSVSGGSPDIYVSFKSPGPGPIAQWKFDEGSGATAYDSAGTNDGTIYGATWTTGKIDGALSFDGSNDYVDVGNDSSLMTTGDLTICAWIKARKTRACIYSHSWTGWGLGFGIGNNNYDGRLGFYTWTHGYWIEAGGSLADDTWHHVAVTLEGTMVRLYSDGIEIGNESGTPASNLTGIGLIGLYNYDWHFGGIIDDLMIYSSALSAGEIEELYQSEVPVAETYHVDGATGDNTNDGLTKEMAFKTIQRGINVAEDYDTVLVWPGVYNEEIGFWGDAITVKSAADAAVVETDYGYAFSFFSAEEPDTVLSNFVIRNSQFGIYLVNGSSPTLSNLTIVNNDIGISAFNGSDPDISNCIFWGNYYGDLFRDPVPLEAKYSFVQDDVNVPNVPLEGLVSHWKFDEGSGPTAYDSAGTYDSTVYGAQWTTGQFNGALDFDGVDDYVALPDNEPVWLPQYNFTLAVWVCPTGSSGAKILDLNFTASANPDYDQGYAVGRNNSGQISFEMNTTTTPDENTRTNDALVEGRWYHVVAVRDGTTQAIYLDGQLNVSRTCASDPIDFVGGYDDDRVNIGRVTTNIGTAFHLEGKIDEFLIYDRALSSKEIEQLYQGVGPSGGPLFVDAANGDYHLLSERGRYWPAHDVWVLDKVTSPCVDGGDPAVGPGDEPMPNGGRINMGAYGGTAYASMSEWPLKHDSNFDGIVNMLDLAELAQEWLQGVAVTSPPPLPQPLPSQTSNPNPSDGAAKVDIDADLSWTPGSDAYSHNVHFGETSPGTFRGNQAIATFEPGTMAYDTTYYWRIDEVNSSGTTTGTVWIFTTEAVPP
ncbi:MAG: PD40 domain-containing protein, partial [Desulfobacteraceae bacterium]|nr:PD40 domain-containing protein [Desulfobacteraceae bacterium]